MIKLNGFVGNEILYKNNYTHFAFLLKIETGLVSLIGQFFVFYMDFILYGLILWTEFDRAEGNFERDWV